MRGRRSCVGAAVEIPIPPPGQSQPHTKKHLPFSRQMLSLLLCITSCIECAASCPVPYKQSLFYKLLDCVLDGSFAECRAKLHDFTLGERADLIVDSPTYRFDRRQLLINQHHALLKVTVRSQNGLQQILDKRRGIFCIFRPAFLTLLKRIVVKIIVFCNLAFKGDISADYITGTVQHQCCQQSAHSAVAVRQYHIETPQESDS